MRIFAAVTAVLILGGCQIAPQVAVSAGVTLFGIANNDLLAFMKINREEKACSTSDGQQTK